MKKVILFSAICLAALSATSQKYTDIKNLLILNKFEQAKTDFEKAITNAKFAGNAEAYILKTAIYTGLASSAAVKSTPDGAKYTDEAFTAFKKYKEMDASMALATDPIYQNGPVNLYSNLYSSGYDAYSKSNWQPAYEKLKSAVEMSDALLSLKILTVPIDTNVLILAGITAEKSNNRDDAAKFYGRLADAKITGEGFESIYRYMVSYAVEKKDMASFEKYKKLGIELFPQSEFFTYDKVDFAVGLAEGFENKKKALDEVLATDPTNYKANQIMGEIIYDTLNSDKEGAVMPANAAELEKTMVSSFLKAAAAKPESEISYLYIGDHFINKASKINDARSAHIADMKTRTKPGTMASKEDVAKRDLLDAQYGEELEKAKEPYEKAAAMFAARVKQNNGLELRDKEQYKKAINYLSEIAMFKRIQSKGKPADITKYTAEEKKWNDLYDTINAIPTLKKGEKSEVPKNTTNDNSNSAGVIKMQEQAGGTYKVPCELNGVKMEFIFDSGASDVTISLTEANFMFKNGHLNKDDIVSTSTKKYEIANGQLVEGIVINIRELKIGNYILKNVQGSIVKTASAPLLLGMSAIKKLGFKFDPANGTLFK